MTFACADVHAPADTANSKLLAAPAEFSTAGWSFNTDYLFELAQLFTAFYDQCPVLKAEEPVRDSRLALCALVLRRLSGGLELLGIETPENM